ncbi:MAG TPA: hypothetical protein VNI58_00940 [Mariprofundaceae bacterium]|nr:hypothetical protein [Mariprofundaceae bacterium]
MRKLWLASLFLLTLIVPAGAHSVAVAAGPSEGASSEMIMQQFAGDDEESPERKITTKRKHQVLAIMGIALLVLLVITGTLGVAMVAFGKNVFVPHMIFAGLSLTLAIAHAATSIAWFWPY